MFEKNSLPFGILLAMFLPAVAFGALYGLFMLLENFGWVSDAGFSPMFRERTSAIIAIGLNAILLNSFHKRRLDRTVRGIVLATIVLVTLWLIIFGKYVL